MPGLEKMIQILKRFWVPILTVSTPIFWTWVFALDDTRSTEVSPSHAMRCLYVLCIMATYWMTSVFPLAITSLIPVAIFPLLGILSTEFVVMQYLNNATMMFLGALILAIGVETSGLHKRIALKIMLMIGTSPKRIMLSCMLATAFLSMWISNTATAAMMLPIVDAICNSLPKDKNENDDDRRKRRNLLLLSIAYAANIGGTGVISGSPPNLLVLSELPEESGLNFATWMGFAIPLMLVNLFICWLWLTFAGMRLFGPGRQTSNKMIDEDEDQKERGHSNRLIGLEANSGKNSSIIENQKTSNEESETKTSLIASNTEQNDNEAVARVIQQEYDSLGSMKLDEFFMLCCFTILICLWIFQKPRFMTGWADELETNDKDGNKVIIGAATPALFMVLIMFALPKKNPLKSLSDTNPPGILTWEIIQQKLQWGVIILLGGGMALSKGVKASGLSDWLVDKLYILKNVDLWGINLIICLLTATITEFVSNTATANILAPILKQMSALLCSNPIYLVLSSVITCSYAFMSPVASPPNAIAYSASTMSPRDMASTGFMMNIICVITTTIAINSYGVVMFGLNNFPTWAEQFNPSSQNITCDV